MTRKQERTPQDERVYVPPEKSRPVTHTTEGPPPSSNRGEEVSRAVESVWQSHETMEGAGVRLRRAFGNPEVPRLDPFLLLDDFRSDDPADYSPGFPWHPHRGIETVTYMLDGYVDHGDSLGNAGRIGPGDVQWMTAGSGIIHQEMPKGREDRMGGMQLWVNLPRSAKMSGPRYQEFRDAHIPTVGIQGGQVRVVAGTLRGTQGPVGDIAVQPEFLDVALKPNTPFDHPIPRGHRAFAYILEGSALFEEGGDPFDARHLVVLKDGDQVQIEAKGEGARFILVSGKPLGEPVAWWGPIVMNQQSELEQAVKELNEGTFIKGSAEKRGDAEGMQRKLGDV